MTNSQHRFSDRVDNYVKYRPHYPAALYDFLREKGIVAPHHVIADIGCGTGISAKLFLERKHTVYGIEPNSDMLNAASIYLSDFSGFRSVTAPAEQTGLPAQSVDLVLCAQAFHWFDQQACKKEFQRILKPEGKVLLVWNDRRTPDQGFLRSYEDFLRLCGTDYKEVNHRNVQDKNVFTTFFGHSDFEEARFDNHQDFNFEGLKGRVLSSSYIPGEGHKDHEYMLYCLKKLFIRYQQEGLVRFEYDTRIYYGTLK